MAELRVERKSRGGKTWLWILLLLVVLIVAAVLLDRAGYIDVPGISMIQSELVDVAMAAPAAALYLQEG